MPRQYTMGRRAGPKADNRARIVAAAVEIYRDRGMAAASNLAIARAADVAPATVRNHFPEAWDLPRAVFAAVLEELEVRPPTSSTASTTFRPGSPAWQRSLPPSTNEARRGGERTNASRS